jgi:hypothetical protein
VTAAIELGAPSAGRVERTERSQFAIAYVGLCLLGLATIGFSELFVPARSLVAVALLLLLSVVVFARPVVGVYVVVAFTLLGDINTTPWYPFAKNFSSRESILFVSDQVIVSPLEYFLVLTTASWLLRAISEARWRFHAGVLLRPVVVFAGFVVLGLLYGLARGGTRNIALYEARPLLYVPLVYVLATNLLTTSRHYERLVWVAMFAITAQSVLAIHFYRGLPPGVRENLESLTEHSGAVHMNALIMFTLAAWLLTRCSARVRLGLLAMTVPVVWAYFVAQRRAAVVGLALGILLFAALLFRLRRRVFWWFLPTVAVLGVGYLAAFWNVQDGLGFPAQAIKTLIAPGQLSAQDQSSDLYRQVEAYDIWYTIRAQPLFGIGFGHPFYQPVPLPDISFFVYWQYLPHHSFLWVWLKLGFAGFVSMIYLVFRTIQHGVRTTLTSPPGTRRAIAATVTLYVVMYMVYSYVDIGWDIRSMVFLAVAMAICADLPDPAPTITAEHAVGRPRSPVAGGYR